MHNFSKQEQVQVVETTLIYKQVKVDIQKELLNKSKGRNYLLDCLKQELNSYEGKDHYNVLEVIYGPESDQFNEQLMEIILFLD